MGWSGLHIIDVSSPSSPQEVGFYELPDMAVDVAVFGDHAYVADVEAGLYILRFRKPGSSTISGQIFNNQGQPLPYVTVSDSTNQVTTTDSLGNYTITGVFTGTYTITPTKEGYTFSPASRTVTVPPSAAGQDFVGSAVSNPPVDLSIDESYPCRFLKAMISYRISRWQ